MEIITLRFVVTEDDLNGLLIRFVAIPRKVRDLHLRVTPDGLSLAGVYQTILPIPFNTEWRIVVEAGKLVARLSGMKAVGVGLGFLKGYVLKAVSSSSTLIELKGDRLSSTLIASSMRWLFLSKRICSLCAVTTDAWSSTAVGGWTMSEVGSKRRVGSNATS